MAGAPLEREVWGYFLSPLNLCFLLGVALYYMSRNGVPKRIALACLGLGSVALATQVAQDAPLRWLVALGFSALIVFAVSMIAQHFRPARWLIWAGAASYAIYLVHNPAQSLAVRLVSKALPIITPGIAFLLVASLSLLAGLAYHLCYERQALRLAKGMLLPGARNPQRSEPSRSSLSD